MLYVHLTEEEAVVLRNRVSSLLMVAPLGNGRMRLNPGLSDSRVFGFSVY